VAEVLLFHHVQGLTPGVTALADAVRAAGHTVHTPDLFEGKTFDTIDEGFAYSQEERSPSVDELADAAAGSLPAELVYAGISFGVMPAQRLAQTRAGARGALLLEACVSITADWAFGPWPDAVPVQIHGMDADPFFAGEGDLDAAQELVSLVPDAELFVYPGDRHLFTDRSLPSYDAAAAELVTQRVLDLLGRL
jgi:dienelactone hydrolase